MIDERSVYVRPVKELVCECRTACQSCVIASRGSEIVSLFWPRQYF